MRGVDNGSVLNTAFRARAELLWQTPPTDGGYVVPYPTGASAPQRPDDVFMGNDGLLIIKLPTTELIRWSAVRPDRSSKTCFFADRTSRCGHSKISNENRRPHSGTAVCQKWLRTHSTIKAT
jgi:hypothetical protein